MTRVYSEIGEATPVTVIEAGPCKVLQVKTPEVDGYSAVQIGFSDKKASRINKPETGHFSKSDSEGFYFLREFRVEDAAAYTVGQTISIDEIMKVGDKVVFGQYAGSNTIEIDGEELIIMGESEIYGVVE